MPRTEIVDYDPAWPGLASAAIAELTNALAGVFAAVEHIGSTAVPGLAAKPVIDLMAAVRELATVVQHESSLTGIGFQRHENGMSDRVHSMSRARRWPMESWTSCDLTGSPAR